MFQQTLIEGVPGLGLAPFWLESFRSCGAWQVTSTRFDFASILLLHTPHFLEGFLKHDVGSLGRLTS